MNIANMAPTSPLAQKYMPEPDSIGGSLWGMLAPTPWPAATYAGDGLDFRPNPGPVALPSWPPAHGFGPADASESARHEINLAALLICLRIEESALLPPFPETRPVEAATMPQLAGMAVHHPVTPWPMDPDPTALALWNDDLMNGFHAAPAPDTSWLLL